MLHLVIPGWLCGLLAGALLESALIVLTPHISAWRRIAAAVLLIAAIVLWFGAVSTVHIG